MKKIVILIFSFFMIQNVWAKEMVAAEGTYLFNEKTKKIIIIEEGTKLETLDSKKHPRGYYVTRFGQEYYVPGHCLASEEDYKAYLKATKPTIKNQSNDNVFNEVDVNLNKPWLEEIVEDYKPRGFSERAVLENLMAYIRSLNLYYSFDSNAGQFTSIENGYTACLGITFLQKELIDKTDLEYRIVLESPCNYKTEEIDPKSPRHIFMEVKVDGKWRNMDAVNMLRQKESKNQPATFFAAKRSNKALFNSLMEKEVDYENKHFGKFFIAINENYPDVLYDVSGTYKHGKKVEDSDFSVMYSREKIFDFLSNR